MMEPPQTPRLEILRKSMGPRHGVSPLRRSVANNSSPLTLYTSNNDDDERSQRIAQAAVRKSLSRNSLSTSLPIVELSRLFGDEEAMDKVRMGLKLFSENKITQRNVWSMQVIDALSQIVLNRKTDVFQLATMSLEVSGKVYAMRVDDVYNMCLKLASQMAQGKESDDDDGYAEGRSTLNASTRTKGRKRRNAKAKNNRNIIDKTKKSCFGPLQKIDSSFFTVREDIECSTTQNLFTFKLPSHESGVCFKILSNEKFWVEAPKPPASSETKTYTIKLPTKTNMSLCAPFKEFVLDEWDRDQEKATEDRLILDEEGFPIPELDGSIYDNFQNDGNFEEGNLSEVEEMAPQAQKGTRCVVDLIPEDAREESEYGYRNGHVSGSGTIFDKMWAGPNHWKAKFVHRSATRFTGLVQQKTMAQKRIRTKKEPNRIDFSLKFGSVEHLKKIPNKKGPLMGDVKSIAKVTLPMRTRFLLDFTKNLNHYNNKNVETKFWSSRAVEPDENGNVEVYNYDNPNDSLYCPNSQGDNDDDDHGNDEGIPENVEDGPVIVHENFIGDNLIDAPSGIAVPIYVPYALQAKKADMKKLKLAIWNSICLRDNDADDDYTIQAKSYSTVFRELPTVLPPSMTKDLSCANTFVALLHLCNEKQLFLKQDDRFQDFIVKKYQADEALGLIN